MRPVRYAVLENGALALHESEAGTSRENEAFVRASLAVLTLTDLAGSGERRTPGRGLVGERDEGGRVVVAPDFACGACERCRAGLGAHCESRMTLGDPGAPGALSEAIIVPERQLAAVPDHVPDETAALAVVASVALQAAGRLHVRESPYATVIGAGAEAVLAAQALALESATVRVLSSNQATLDACEKRGVPSRRTPEAGRLGDQDIVVVCPGEEGAFDTSLAMTAPRGRVVLTPGISARSEALSLASEREIDVLGSRWAPIAEGLAALAEGRLDASGLITKRVKLDRAAEAVESLRSGDELAIAVDFT